MCRRFDPAPNHFQSEALLSGAGLFFAFNSEKINIQFNLLSFLAAREIRSLDMPPHRFQSIPSLGSVQLWRGLRRSSI